MFRISARLSLVAAVLAIALGTAQAQLAAKKVTFLTNYTFAGRDAPLFVAVEKGFFRDAGFDVTIQPATGSGFAVTAVDSGKADYGMADPGSVIKAVANGAKVKGFDVFMDVTPNGLAALTSYPTPQSLMGAKIAAAQTDSARVILPIIFRQKGLDPSKINWIAADPSVYISLLLSGQTDLYTASIDGDVPALERVAAPRKKEVHFSSFADWGYDAFGLLLITQASRIAADPGEVKRFAAAVAKGVAYAVQHPNEAARITVKYAPTLKEDVTQAQWKQSIKTIETPYVKQHGYGVATADRVQKTIDLVSQALTLPAKPTADQIFALGLATQ